MIQILLEITAYAVLVILAIIAFRKQDQKTQQTNMELHNMLVLLRNSSKREQALKYKSDRQLSKLDRVIKKLSK